MNKCRILTVALLALAAASPRAAASYEFHSKFGSFGTAAGQFDSPRGVAVNGSGQIIITESGNHRVQVCSTVGSCSAWGTFGTESEEFDRPRGVTVNATDRIFVADRGNDRVQNCNVSGVCTAFGNSGSAPGQFDSPRGIVALDDGRLAITDTDNHRVQLCTEQGSCTVFGSAGSGLGQFISPAGIAELSDGRLAIADRGNDRIQLCSKSGVCTAFGSFGNSVGQFDTPAGVAVDSQNRIVIVDRFNHRVQVCSTAGNCQAFGSFGSGNGQFSLPWGVAVDAMDRIIVADLENHRIQIFAEPTAPIFQINAGLNDAWVNDSAPFQGFFFTVFENLGLFFLSWFTFDSVPPSGDTGAVFGAADTRWVTASGLYSGDSVTLSVELTTGGVFNDSDPSATQQAGYGTITIVFLSCSEALLSYDFPGPGLSGQMTINRVLPSNVALCEALEGG